MLRGGGGDDVLVASDGVDMLYGGAGANTLIGGVGTNAFKFEADADDDRIDTIVDFDQAARERIDLRNFDGGAGTFVFRGQGAFVGDGTAQLRFAVSDLDADGVGDDAQLQFDMNGDGTVDELIHVLNATGFNPGTDFAL